MATDPETINSSDITNKSDDPFEKAIDLAIEAQDGPTDKSATTNTEDKTAEDGKQSTDAGKPSDGDNKNNQQQQPPNATGKKDEGKTGAPQDLTLKDGTVVKGGSERRFYEQRETARQEAQHYKQMHSTATQQINTLTQQLNTLRETAQAATGLPPEQSAVAINMYRDMVQDPVGTLKKLLAEATAKGYRIEGIAEGVDAEAIKRIVAGASQMQTQTDGPDEATIAREAETEWRDFVSQFPDVQPHDALIGSMLRDNPSLSLQDAYFSLKNEFINRGLDFSRPLAEQQQSVPQNNQQQQKPLPNGRMPVADTQMQDANKIIPASSSTSLDDIIKESMRESGMNI